MPDFNIRSDSINVEEIMQQIRARIREKRGVDYTEQEIRDLAAAKLEKFLDPAKVRSDLLQQYRQLQGQQTSVNAALDEERLFGSARPLVRRIRRLLRPILKLFLNPLPLTRASRVHETLERQAELFYELVHNLVVETTRLSIEVKTLKMRVESLSSRLDFDERRARALEGSVQYRSPTPTAGGAATLPAHGDEEQAPAAESAASRNRRRRRRRGRRGGQRAGFEEAAAGGEVARPPGEDRPRDDASPPGEGDHPPGATSLEGEPAAAAPAQRSDDQSQNTSPAADATQPREAGRAPHGEPGSEEPGT